MRRTFLSRVFLGALGATFVAGCGHKPRPPVPVTPPNPKPAPVVPPHPPLPKSTPTVGPVAPTIAPPPEPVVVDEDVTPAGFLTQDQVVDSLLAMRSTGLIELPAADEAEAERVESVLNAGDFTKSLRPIRYDGLKHTGLSADGRVSRDLRHFDTPVRSQGSRGTCTAFGTTAALENLWNRKSEGKAVHLSPEHLWSCYGRPYTQGAIGCAQKIWVVPETVWPYGKRRVRVSPDQGVLNEPGWDSVDPTVAGVAQAVVDDRTAVVFAFDVSRSFVRAQSGVVNPFDRSVVGGHAVELVGVVKDARLEADFGGGYFIIKNSWGKTYGDKGSAYLPFKYCETHTCYEAFKPSFDELQTR